MDVVNLRNVLPQEEKLTQVEELVKHQISRVEKILASSLTRTAALIEQHLNRATEDEEKRQNIEKERIIQNTIETTEKNNSIKTEHDEDLTPSTQENKLKDALISKVSLNNHKEVLFNPIHTEKRSKTFKSVGTNTDERIELYSQIPEDNPSSAQPLVVFDSAANHKRQVFARRKVYKHEVGRATGPICTINISVNQPPERTRSYIEESRDTLRIVVKTANRGSNRSDVLMFNDAVQKNIPEFSTMKDIAEEKKTLEDFSEFHTNAQVKEKEPKTVSNLNVRSSNIDETSLKTQLQGDGMESYFSDTTPYPTTSKSVSGDNSSERILIDKARERKYKRKANKNKCNRDKPTVSSNCDDELSLKRNGIKSSRTIIQNTRKKHFDQEKGDGDTQEIESRYSASEGHNFRKSECRRYIEMKCVSEGNRSSFPNLSNHSHLKRRQYYDQSERRSDCDSSSNATDKKPILKLLTNSSIKTASISSNNTSSGLSGNLSEASLEYQNLENEPNLISSNICLDSDNKAIKYSQLDSSDDIPEAADVTHSNGNKEHHFPNGDVTLLQGFEGDVIKNPINDSNNVEQKTNLQLKEYESDHTDTCEVEKLKPHNGSREPNTDSIKINTVLNNQELSLSATNIGGNNANSETCSESNSDTVQTGCKSESKPKTSVKSTDITLPCMQSVLDDSSCTARSFEDKYHLVMDTLEKHLEVSKASKYSHDAHSGEINPNKKINKGRRSRSKCVSLENHVSCDESFQNGPLTEPVISKRKGKQQVTTHVDLFHETPFVIEEKPKSVDVISVSKSEANLNGDFSMAGISGRLDSLIYNHNIDNEDEKSTLNDLSLNVTPKLENYQTMKSLNLTVNDSTVNVHLTPDACSDIITSGTSLCSEVEGSSTSLEFSKQHERCKIPHRKNKVVDRRCNNIDNCVGESRSTLDLDSTDNEGLDSSFYERNASGRYNVGITNDSSSNDSNMSFVVESSVKESSLRMSANEKENTRQVSDSSVSIPLSLEYYSDLVTPVTSLRYVIDEWSEPLRNPFKMKQKTKRINRKKVITDVHVKQPNSFRRSSTPCQVFRDNSVSSNIYENGLVDGESELRTSVIQFPSIQEPSNTKNGKTSEISVGNSITKNDDEPTNSYDQLHTISFQAIADQNDSFLSHTASVDAFQQYLQVSSVTNDPTSRNTNSFQYDELEDEATTTEDVASSILPEDVDDTTDVDEQLQMDETDFSELTDVLGTSTETFTKIENPNYKSTINEHKPNT